MNRFARVIADDWEGLYDNGVLVLEGHSIDWRDVMRHLGHDCETTREVDPEWMHNRGRLPEKLEDVP